MTENRHTARSRLLKSGKIVFNQARSSIDCTVRNRSETGAAVAVESPIGIPDELDLVIGAEPSRRCRVVWRKANSLGLRFHTEA